MTDILNLPGEVVRLVASYLQPNDLLSLRLSCSYMERHAFNAFTTCFFREIHIIPTLQSLDALNQVAKHESFRTAVREIVIIGSVCMMSDRCHCPGQLVRSSEVRKQNCGCGIQKHVDEVLGYQGRIKRPPTIPYSDPKLPWEDCANEFVELILSEDFKKSLASALAAFSSATIKAYQSPVYVDPGRSRTIWGHNAVKKRTIIDPCPRGGSRI